MLCATATVVKPKLCYVGVRAAGASLRPLGNASTGLLAAVWAATRTSRRAAGHMKHALAMHWLLHCFIASGLRYANVSGVLWEYLPDDRTVCTALRSYRIALLA